MYNNYRVIATKLIWNLCQVLFNILLLDILTQHSY